MLENRLILTATIGYIIGILMGLYCKISIVLFYVIIYMICLFCIPKKKPKKFKLFSCRRYFRYMKILFTKKVVIIIICFSIISNSIVLFQNYQYDNLYQNLYGKDVNIYGVVCEKTNKRYKLKVMNSKYRNTYLYIIINNKKCNIEYGDEVFINGVLIKPAQNRNYKGFNYRNYLKTQKIYGTIKVSKYKIYSKRRLNLILQFTNQLAIKIKEKIHNLDIGDDGKSILEGIFIGDKSNISDDIIEDFSKSNISYLLAISGMHISYIILVTTLIFNKIIGKHGSKVITSIIIVIYMGIVKFTPSVVRAGITSIISINSKFFYKRNDVFQSFSLSLLIVLLYNPFLIYNMGLILSFAGYLGIVMWNPLLKSILKKYIDKCYLKSIRKNKVFLKKIIQLVNTKWSQSLQDIIIITISANIMVAPIILIVLNKINITNLCICIISNFFIGPIVVLGLILIFFKFKILEVILDVLLKVLIYISSLGSKLPFYQIYFYTPNIVWLEFYYSIIFFIYFMLKIELEKNPNMFYRRIKNIYHFVKFKLKINKKRIISCVLVLNIFILFLGNIPKNLKIYFVDVGQGDCSLIQTSTNKNILIDGGGSASDDFDVGKKILIPYLLDRKIPNIDYVIISHFDTDHVGGLLTVMEELKVDTAVISKQQEKCPNLDRFKEIVKEKNIKVILVEKGDILKIDKDLYFDILWPNNSNPVTENVLNNNSIVCKLHYRNFSMLFTGDIEEIAEKQILREYSNNLQVLNSTILKVAHHGSKTSSTQELLDVVKPKVAIIGVGVNNKFGHPSDDVIKKLENIR